MVEITIFWILSLLFIVDDLKQINYQKLWIVNELTNPASYLENERVFVKSQPYGLFLNVDAEEPIFDMSLYSLEFDKMNIFLLDFIVDSVKQSKLLRFSCDRLLHQICGKHFIDFLWICLLSI